MSMSNQLQHQSSLEAILGPVTPDPPVHNANMFDHNPSKRTKTQHSMSPFRAGAPAAETAFSFGTGTNPAMGDDYPTMGTASISSPRPNMVVQGARNFMARTSRKNKRRHPENTLPYVNPASGESKSRSPSPDRNPMNALTQVSADPQLNNGIGIGGAGVVQPPIMSQVDHDQLLAHLQAAAQAQQPQPQAPMFQQMASPVVSIGGGTAAAAAAAAAVSPVAVASPMSGIGSPVNAMHHQQPLPPPPQQYDAAVIQRLTQLRAVINQPQGVNVNEMRRPYNNRDTHHIADPTFIYPAMDPHFDPEPVRQGSLMLYQAATYRLWLMDFPKEIRKESSTKKDNIFLKRHSNYRVGVQMTVNDPVDANEKPKVEVSFERPGDRTMTNKVELEGGRDSPAFFVFNGNLNASGMPRSFCKLKKTAKNNVFHLFVHVNGEKSKMPYAFEIVAFKRDERKNRKNAVAPPPAAEQPATTPAMSPYPAAAAGALPAGLNVPPTDLINANGLPADRKSVV